MVEGFSDKDKEQIAEILRNTKAEFPDSLNQRDKELVVEQCIHQSATSTEQIMGFARCYAEAKELALDNGRLAVLNAEQLGDLILRWAEIIEERNRKGFRTTPVRFANMSTALSADAIPQAMRNFCEAYAEARFTPVEAYTEFQKIHPLEDGNGRLGDLLWKIATTREVGAWPEELPPKVFG